MKGTDTGINTDQTRNTVTCRQGRDGIVFVIPVKESP